MALCKLLSFHRFPSLVEPRSGRLLWVEALPGGLRQLANCPQSRTVPVNASGRSHDDTSAPHPGGGAGLSGHARCLRVAGQAPADRVRRRVPDTRGSAGPQVTGLFTPAAIEAFQPIAILGIGWMGITAALPLRLQRLVRVPAVHYRLALVEAIATLALVTAGAVSALHVAFEVDMATAGACVVLGAIAVASTPAGLDVAYGDQRHDSRRRAPVLQQIEVANGMDAFLSVLAFGIMIAMMHVAAPVMIRALTTTEWVVVTLGIGAVGGTLFHLFLGNERSPDRLFISLGGAVILTSGAAAYLNLSPTLAAFVMGVILVNSCVTRGRWRKCCVARSVRCTTCCCCWPVRRGRRHRVWCGGW